MPNRYRAALDRFYSKIRVDARTGCWLWQGALDGNGYGEFRDKGRLTSSHRWAYQRFTGPIPKGLQIDHCCRPKPNKSCCNPAHLEVVTNSVNTQRAYDRKRAALQSADLGAVWVDERELGK